MGVPGDTGIRSCCGSASRRGLGGPLDTRIRDASTMTRGFLLGLVAGTLAVAVGWAAGAAGQGDRAVVITIGDGDTIRVRQAGRILTVRLACIDAPESDQSPFGLQSRRYLQQDLPRNRQISLDVKSIDRYGRTVAEVFSGVNINLAMVEDGQAFAYHRYLST